MDCDREASALAFAELLDVFSNGLQFLDSDYLSLCSTPFWTASSTFLIWPGSLTSFNDS